MQLRLVSKTHIALSLNRLAITLASATLISAGVFTASSASAQSGNIPASQVSNLNAQGAYDDQTLRSFATVATTVATPEAPVVVPQTPHQIVRDEAEFKPIAEKPQIAAVTPPAMPSQDYANSISGGRRGLQSRRLSPRL